MKNPPSSNGPAPITSLLSRRRVLTGMAMTAPLALSSSGCLFMALSNTSASEDDLKEHWYTYASQTPFRDSKQGLVLGRVSLGGQGCTFNVQRTAADTWANVEQTLEFRTSAYRGILFGHTFTTHTKKTFDIYAGNGPLDRREALSTVLGQGSLVSSVFMGDSDYTLNQRALETFMSTGWFFLRLPAGPHRIANLAYEQYDTQTSSTTTTVSVRSNSRAIGPEFEVKPGVVNYIGEHAYAGDVSDAVSTSDLSHATTNLLQATRRLPGKGGTAWKIEATAGVKA